MMANAAGRRPRVLTRPPSLFLFADEFLHEVEEHGNKKNGDESGGEYSADHEDGAEAQFRAFERGFHQPHPFFVFRLGEFDDEDGILRCKAAKRDQADLRVDLLFAIPRNQSVRNAPKDRARCA